jgi:hypothetical protein
MTAAPVRTSSRLALAVLAALAATLALACGPDFFEIPIETPIQPKLDVSGFQRVLVAGFVVGGSEDVDTNQETVRLLRSQLRTRSQLKVIDADIMPLMTIAQDQRKEAGEGAAAPGAAAPGTSTAAPAASTASGTSGTTTGTTLQTPAVDRAAQSQGALPQQIREEKDLEPYERLFANTAYWKKIGEEYQNPLIVTGTVLFIPHSITGPVVRDQTVTDQYGRQRVVSTRVYIERKGFILEPKFVFIDGRTGATMYSERHREEVLYPAQQNTPALSTYFELMDRIVPDFLSALSSQKIKGTRVLLK